MRNNKLSRLLAMSLCFVLGVGSLKQPVLAAEEELTDEYDLAEEEEYEDADT